MSRLCLSELKDTFGGESAPFKKPGKAMTMEMIEFDPEVEAEAIRDAARKLGDKHPEVYGELADSGRITMQGFPLPVMARVAMADGTKVYFMRQVSGTYSPWIY